MGYLYTTTGQAAEGLVNGYKIDYQQGYLVQLANSPIASGGRYPITIVASPDHLSLYVINRDDSNVVHFLIGTDGKVYPQKTYNITGSFATDASIDASGKFLYVTFTYQNTQLPGGGQQQLYTPANPGPGGVTIFPVGSDGSAQFACNRQPWACSGKGLREQPQSLCLCCRPGHVDFGKSLRFLAESDYRSSDSPAGHYDQSR